MCNDDDFSYPFTGVIFGIFLAVCQVEVVLVAIATGLIVHFITKVRIKRNLTLSHDRSGKLQREVQKGQTICLSMSLLVLVAPLVNMWKCSHHQLTKRPQSQSICSSDLNFSQQPLLQVM